MVISFNFFVVLVGGGGGGGWFHDELETSGFGFSTPVPALSSAILTVAIYVPKNNQVDLIIRKPRARHQV